jgi:hypothetical protein
VESPWVVVPYSPNSCGQIHSREVESLHFAERWNKINLMLRIESDKWGKYGKYKSPVGEYLEEVSKRPVPDSARGLSRGSRAGIIDVCTSILHFTSSAMLLLTPASV